MATKSKAKATKKATSKKVVTTRKVGGEPTLFNNLSGFLSKNKGKYVSVDAAIKATYGNKLPKHPRGAMGIIARRVTAASGGKDEVRFSRENGGQIGLFRAGAAA